MPVRHQRGALIRRARAGGVDAGRGVRGPPAALLAGVRQPRRGRAPAPGPLLPALGGAVDRAADRGRRSGRSWWRSGARSAAALAVRATRCRSPRCGCSAPPAWWRSTSRRSSSRACSRPATRAGWSASSATAAGGRSRRRSPSAWCLPPRSTAPAGCSRRSPDALGARDVPTASHARRPAVVADARLRPSSLPRPRRWPTAGPGAVLPRLIAEPSLPCSRGAVRSPDRGGTTVKASP